jgi:hypothetical protein
MTLLKILKDLFNAARADISNPSLIRRVTKTPSKPSW